jgi:hypothetical protein
MLVASTSFLTATTLTGTVAFVCRFFGGMSAKTGAIIWHVVFALVMIAFRGVDVYRPENLIHAKRLVLIIVLSTSVFLVTWFVNAVFVLSGHTHGPSLD